jgi:hypothetical protein
LMTMKISCELREIGLFYLEIRGKLGSFLPAMDRHTSIKTIHMAGERHGVTTYYTGH